MATSSHEKLTPPREPDLRIVETRSIFENHSSGEKLLCTAVLDFSIEAIREEVRLLVWERLFVESQPCDRVKSTGGSTTFGLQGSLGQGLQQQGLAYSSGT